MYSLLAREHGWTYKQIGIMPLDDFFDAISSIYEHQKNVLPIDVSLNAICVFFGIKKKSTPVTVDTLKKIGGLRAFEFTEKQLQEWYKADCPNPSKFFKRIN